MYIYICIYIKQKQKKTKNKNKLKLKKKCISFCGGKSLVVKIDMLSFCLILQRKYSVTFYLNVFKLVQSFPSFGKLFQTDGAKKEIQC